MSSTIAAGADIASVCREEIDGSTHFVLALFPSNLDSRYVKLELEHALSRPALQSSLLVAADESIRFGSQLADPPFSKIQGEKSITFRHTHPSDVETVLKALGDAAAQKIQGCAQGIRSADHPPAGGRKPFCRIGDAGSSGRERTSGPRMGKKSPRSLTR